MGHIGRTRARPLHASKIGGYKYDDSPVNAGMRLLGFAPTPQQDVISRVLGALRRHDPAAGLYVPAYTKVVVAGPRRISKTVSLWAELVGRCETRAGTQVITTAQTGKVGRKRLLSIGLRLTRQGHVRRTRDDPGHIVVGQGIGNEHITWDNGSSIVMLPPKPSAWRSDEADVILIDEGQEFDDPDEADDLLQALMPLFDTRPAAQLIVAGTAGEHRRGLLWAALELGRAGAGWGIVEYAAPDGSDPADEKLWRRTHPGIGTLTTIETMRARWIEYKGDEDPTRFAREYLGMWPTEALARLIPARLWLSCLIPGGARPPRPPRISLAYDVAPNGAHAAIVGAWRDDKGHAQIEVIDHDLDTGYRWVAPRALDIARRYRAAIHYDPIGPNVNVAETLERARPRPTLAPMTLRQYQSACTGMLAAIHDRTLRHQGQGPLDAAVEAASKRLVGESGWVFGRRTTTGDVAALIAAAAALRGIDDIPPDTRPTIHIRTAHPTR